MFTARFFNLVVVIVIIVVIGLTAQEAAATVEVVSQKSSAESVCLTIPAQPSIHTQYEEDMGMWVAYTEAGPTGVDGGLIYLLSESRSCGLAK